MAIILLLTTESMSANRFEQLQNLSHSSTALPGVQVRMAKLHPNNFPQRKQ